VRRRIVIASSISRLAKGAGLLAVGLVLVLVSGCNGPTVVEQAQQVDGYNVGFSMDPQTLKPPQFGTVSYELTDAKTGKPLTAYDTIYGALIHNVLVSSDLTVFRHSYSSRSQLNQFSLGTEFPQLGKYYSFTMFKPTGADLQVVTGTIQAGTEAGEPALVVDTDRAKLSYGSRFELLTGSGAIHAGQPTQLGVYATERGIPITQLWSFLGAPGYLWIIDEEGRDLAVETGASEGRPMPNATPPGQPVPAPTLAAGLSSEFAARQGQPVPTLVPVQATSQVSVIESPGAVVPGVGYGPLIAFTHTFPRAGLYKIWAELNYRNQTVTVDWVLDVEP
jgi:hypothetical protein